MTSCVCPRIPNAAYYRGEEDTLEAMEKFRKFYEDKMKEIDLDGGGDCLELKLKLQERWITDLTEQTEMMAKIVKELEDEATSRVQMLEEKLKHTSKTAYEKVFYLENDLKNLLEFIKRKRDDGKWSIEGLQFYDVTYVDLFGKDASSMDTSATQSCNCTNTKKETSLTMEDDEKSSEFEEILKKKSEEYDVLKQSMLDMRSALTEEVACKHDMISALKKDVQQLEERCVQADKQTAFKDDIIKELRKEIKQLKQQMKKENEERKSEEIEELEKKLQDSEELIRSMRPCVDSKNACTMFEGEVSKSAKEKKLQSEVEELRNKCEELEKSLENSQAIAENFQKAESRCSSKSEVKKLRQQKRCYEHALDCFKHEMAVMSEQLINLQEILKLSNQSCKEENGQLYNAIVNLQNVCDRLQTQLLEAERKIVIENQMNKLKDQKIDELQLIIGQKNADLNFHDAAIQEMKIKLENTILENHELHNTVVTLNSTMMQIQCGRTKSSVCHKQSSVSFKDDDSRKLEQLIRDYKAQHEILKQLQREFDRVKEREKEKQRQLKRQMESLSEKLTTSELNNHKLIQELEILKDQATELAERECCREHELLQSKQIIIELRQTMIELNESLINSDLHHCGMVDAYEKKVQEDRDQNDIYLSCKCEIALYKRLVEDFKETIIKAQRNLSEMESQNQLLRDEINYKDTKLDELQAKLAAKEKETCANMQDLVETLKESRAEERRLTLFIDSLKREVQRKIADNAKARNNNDTTGCACNRAGCGCHGANNDTRASYDASNDSKVGYGVNNDTRAGCACSSANNNSRVGYGANNDTRAGCACSSANNDTRAGYGANNDSRVGYGANNDTRAGCACSSANNDTRAGYGANNDTTDTRLLSCACNGATNGTRVLGCTCADTTNDLGCVCDDSDELESTQQEIRTLKVQIKKLIQNQLSLNSENDKLLKQVTTLQSTVSALEEKNRHLKQKLDKSQLESKKLREQNQLFQREKEIYTQTITNLEVELADLRNSRDDVCAESKCVVNNVKAWLEEQKRLNVKIKKKAQCYCETITKLKQENANLINQVGNCPKTCNNSINKSCNCYTPSPPLNSNGTPPLPPPPFDCSSPWCLDSQGLDTPRDSPTSFQTCSIEEWFAPNYRDETDIETDFEDEFISKLETATLEMKKNNNKWKHKYKGCECLVTKDNK